MFNRSRRRLAYWFTLSMGSILIIFAFTVYHHQIKEQQREFDDRVYAQTKKIAASTSYRQQDKNWQLDTDNISLSDPAIPNGSKIIYIRWYDAEQKLLQFIGNCPTQDAQVTGGWQTLSYDCDLNGQTKRKNMRILTLPLQAETKAAAVSPIIGQISPDRPSLVGYLQVAVSIAPIRTSLSRSRLFFALGVPITLGLTGIVGWILGGLAMHPVRRSYEQLQRFTADASHELRAPVASILSNAQVGLLAPSEDASQPRQRLENIVTQSKYMSDLITNLLFLARHQGKLNPQDINKTDIVSLLAYLASQYQVLAAAKDVALKVDLPSSCSAICGDRDLLQQAIGNLLDNAIKYTPHGGTVYLGLEPKPRRLVITVRDTGIGIPEADLPHIFERFYRVDKTRARQTGGFGLGLAIAQQIITAHHGKISVDSKVNQGTSVQICLPIKH